MRLGLKLFLGFFLIVGLAAFFVMRVFVDEVKPGVRQAMESTLVDAANVLAELAAPEVKAGTLESGSFIAALARAQHRDPKAMVWRFPKRALDYQVSITDAHGVVIYDSLGRDVGRDNSRWNDVHRTLRGEYGARSSPEVAGQPERGTVMHVAAPVLDPVDGRTLIGVLSVSQPNRSIDPFIVASQRQIVLRGAWLIGLSALIGVLITAWLMVGVRRLNRYAQAVSEGLPVAPPKARRDEIGDLGQALERMRRKLEGKAYVEQYVQSLTHEMKSPLAAMRAAAELLQEPMDEVDRQRFAASILDQQQRLTRTIDALLALAEVEQHGWLQARQAVNVLALLEEVVTGMAMQAHVAGVSVQTIAAVGLQVEGDRYLLRQAVNNLLDNAISFSPGAGTVVLQARADGGGVVIDVQDVGSGIPAYARDRVFERFYSLPRPASGQRSSGLGLPFVQEVARLHGGHIHLSAVAEGGTLARLWLPSGGVASSR